MLGLPSGVTFVLPERLPGLPAAPFDPGDVEQTAMDRRLDVQVAKLDAESTARRSASSRRRGSSTCWTSDTRTNPKPGIGARTATRSSWSCRSSTGARRALRARKSSIGKRWRALRSSALNAQSEVRDAYNAYRTNFDLAKHYRDEIVPLHRRIAEENLLRYNGMLIGVFELLADSRQQVASVNAAIEATRDYWLAETALQLAWRARRPAARRWRASPRPP